MNFLRKLLGINLPTIEASHETDKPILVEQEQSHQPPKFIAHVTFIMATDGTVSINTEWLNENDTMVNLYAQLLYQITSGAMEDGIFRVLKAHGEQNVQSQGFLVEVFNQYKEYQNKYKNLPLIFPSQVLPPPNKTIPGVE